MNHPMENQLVEQFSHKQQSKLKHLSACLLPESQYKKSAGFDELTLEHQAAAGLSFNEISLATKFLGHNLDAPLMIAPMTGGMELGALLNMRWAKAAEHFNLAFGVGSQRLALMDSLVAKSFSVRNYAKNAFIFANLGAAQILKNGPDKCLRAVEMIEANALFIHLNPLQEACQENGDVDFTGLIPAIEAIVNVLHKRSLPVFIREVGFGLSKETAHLLINTGISGLDCSGAGGTSWAKVEALCATSQKYRALGETFGEWGIPTVQSIKNVRSVDKEIPLIASGGLRTGIDCAKALALKANLVAMAQPMLSAAIKGEDELFTFIEKILLELRIALYASGAQNIGHLTLL